MLNLDHLACFIEVASQRGFTKAAERLFLSQSTVSRRVSHLEEELGCRLIERTALDFELTPEGKTALGGELRRAREGHAAAKPGEVPRARQRERHGNRGALRPVQTPRRSR